MAEREQMHRHTVERTDVEQPYLLARRGQWFALGLSTLVLAVAVVLALAGSPVVGGMVAALDLAAIIGAYVYSQRRAEQSPPDAAP
jgi:uncharacterized membrane protein